MTIRSDRTQISDTIEYESINLATNARYGPVPVLSETQFAWDSNYICNPKVINGSFANPLGDGKTYTYAMYYVALGATSNNHIGVAFSNDGISLEEISPTDHLIGIGRELRRRPTGDLQQRPQVRRSGCFMKIPTRSSTT